MVVPTISLEAYCTGQLSSPDSPPPPSPPQPSRPGTNVDPLVPALEKIWADSLGQSLADFNFRWGGQRVGCWAMAVGMGRAGEARMGTQTRQHVGCGQSLAVVRPPSATLQLSQHAPHTHATPDPDLSCRTVTSKFNELVYQYPIRIPERYSLVIR